MPEHVPGSDADEGSIVARAQDGDLAAFELLVSIYQVRLFRLAYRMLNDRLDAEDIVQEAFTSSWRSLPMLSDVNAFGGWIYRQAMNKCLDLLRKRSVHPEALTDPDDLRSTCETGANLLSSCCDPADSAQCAAAEDELAQLLNALPPVQKACWLLREIHGRSYAEISDTLKISPSTVRGTLARARHRIAEGMSPWR
ncbi:RNA polymerase sigma factor [Paeniglutamicibacter antarcticus]|uniref:RNA polymerase sigma factor n=1 Tax=Paeniglutamicibacter antarcticus TaxID=494023 RepID=A0ABP9THE9_9MICC